MQGGHPHPGGARPEALTVARATGPSPRGVHRRREELPTLPNNLVAVGQRLACTLVIDGTTTVAMIDPLKGSMTPLLGLPRDYTVALAGAPTGDAVYVGLVASDLILRVPLPAR